MEFRLTAAMILPTTRYVAVAVGQFLSWPALRHGGAVTVVTPRFVREKGTVVAFGNQQ
jgi:hypothetical protein